MDDKEQIKEKKADNSSSFPLSEKVKKQKKKKKKKKNNNEKREKEIIEAKSNIEDIFSNKKVKENNNKKVKEDNNKKIKEDNKLINKNEANKKNNNKISNNKKKIESERLRTPDGLPIYSMDELNMGKGGYTKNCPFDCNCCF
ncbi:hypothetical protein PFAG_03291 [Plasmodium falciparum Santa Lucia]|uniref:DUF1764 domain-containing protein n=3 Tax=Plasmodium falciparum TaxID=5833 RepID=W7KE62_PLAFO|nr:hypothetical protein PFBG_03363 [Plasmodium falciparum 7G8]EUT84200.1 hypothetical protein PFAG_03291 [Plasmodium falciparum Santa Lucia]EWC87932.1 hypothetical protein PFNF54_03163 [Plasmodium falciparum NF54]